MPYAVSVAPAVAKEPSRSRPLSSSASASSWDSAVASRPRITSACSTSSSPAGVRRTPRAGRATRRAPASASSGAIWRGAAGWVKASASAAAEKEPCAATSRRTRRRRTSRGMRKAYTRPAKRSFAVMAREAEHEPRVLPLSPHRGRPSRRSDRRRRHPHPAAAPTPLRHAWGPAGTPGPAPRRGLARTPAGEHARHLGHALGDPAGGEEQRESGGHEREAVEHGVGGPEPEVERVERGEHRRGDETRGAAEERDGDGEGEEADREAGEQVGDAA